MLKKLSSFHNRCELVNKLGKFLIFATLLNINLAAAQQQDTNYYKKYNNRLIITLYSSQRYFQTGFQQKYFSDSLGNTSTTFKATAPETYGFQIDFDKVSLGYDYRTKDIDSATASKTGYTKVSSFSLNFGGNKWMIENSWRRFRGFYDIQTQNNSNYDTTKPYFQNPAMQAITFRSKLLYFTNSKRFSYKSAYGHMYRQFKSSATWLFSGNLYYNRLLNDSAFIPFYLQSYYGDIASLHKINTLGLSALAGFSFNLVVFKRFFLNITLALGPDVQWRYFEDENKIATRRVYTTFSAENRVALGFNNRNVFISLFSSNDINQLKSNFWEIRSEFYSAGVKIGYRFRVKDSEQLKRIRAHKYYNLL